METLSLSGYSQDLEFLAQRTHRGQYQSFTMAVPIGVLTKIAPIPDPASPFPDNRKVNEAHAKKFALYWRSRKNWIAPPILLDTSLDLNTSYEARLNAGALNVGTLTMPYNARDHLRILDGQHRILGWVIAAKELATEVRDARDKLLESRNASNDEGVAVFSDKVARLEESLRRLETEHIAVEILVGVTTEQHKKFFVDIAKNALGISKSRTAAFDQERMMSRIGLHAAQNHPLLASRVDEERDIVALRADYLMSLKNVIELARESTWGVPSRWTDNREKFNDESRLTNLAMQFFTTMCDAFSDLAEVRDGALHPAKLRSTSLLGSVSFMRVLAGTYAALAITGTKENEPKRVDEGVAKFLELAGAIEPHLRFITTESGTRLPDAWLASAAAAFFPNPESKAPVARSQDMRAFVELMTAWGEQGNALEPAVAMETDEN